MKKFENKDPSELRVLTFDFTDDLAVGETLSGTLLTTIACILGTDSTPSNVFNGGSSFDATNKMVLVPVKGGADGCDYTIKVVSNTSNALKVLALTALLSVRNGG